MNLKVVKADGSVEDYLHTKVMGTICNALAATGEPDIFIAEELAEVVTYYLYNKDNRHTVSSSEVFSVIKTVLESTAFEQAAVLLSEYHYHRQIRRARIEVIDVNVRKLGDARKMCTVQNPQNRSRWNKSIIITDLVAKHSLNRQLARVVAAMVEEKILGMQVNVVSRSLISQLVIADAAAVLSAQNQLALA